MFSIETRIPYQYAFSATTEESKSDEHRLPITLPSDLIRNQWFTTPHNANKYYLSFQVPREWQRDEFLLSSITPDLKQQINETNVATLSDVWIPHHLRVAQVLFYREHAKYAQRFVHDCNANRFMCAGRYVAACRPDSGTLSPNKANAFVEITLANINSCITAKDQDLQTLIHAHLERTHDYHAYTGKFHLKASEILVKLHKNTIVSMPDDAKDADAENHMQCILQFDGKVNLKHLQHVRFKEECLAVSEWTVDETANKLHPCFTNLCIQNWPERFDGMALLKTFAAFGTVEKCEAHFDGLAFVKYENHAQAMNAINSMNPRMFAPDPLLKAVFTSDVEAEKAYWYGIRVSMENIAKKCKEFQLNLLPEIFEHTTGLHLKFMYYGKPIDLIKKLDHMFTVQDSGIVVSKIYVVDEKNTELEDGLRRIARLHDKFKLKQLPDLYHQATGSSVRLHYAGKMKNLLLKFPHLFLLRGSAVTSMARQPASARNSKFTTSTRIAEKGKIPVIRIARRPKTKSSIPRSLSQPELSSPCQLPSEHYRQPNQTAASAVHPPPKLKQVMRQIASKHAQFNVNNLPDLFLQTTGVALKSVSGDPVDSVVRRFNDLFIVDHHVVTSKIHSSALRNLSVPRDSSKHYVCVRIPAEWNKDELLCSFAQHAHLMIKYPRTAQRRTPTISDVWVRNHCRVAYVTLASPQLAQQLIEDCNSDRLTCLGRTVRAYQDAQKECRVNIVNINACITADRLHALISPQLAQNHPSFQGDVWVEIPRKAMLFLQLIVGTTIDCIVQLDADADFKPQQLRGVVFGGHCFPVSEWYIQKPPCSM